MAGTRSHWRLTEGWMDGRTEGWMACPSFYHWRDICAQQLLSQWCVRTAASVFQLLSRCFVVEKCLMMFVSVPSQCSIRRVHLCVSDLSVFRRHLCYCVSHVFISTSANKTQHTTVSWIHHSILYVLVFSGCRTFHYWLRNSWGWEQGGIGACRPPLIQVFKWHEKQQRAFRGVTGVCLWREKHPQTHPAFLQWQERKRKQRLGGVSMEERQPSAAARARQTMTPNPFCASKTTKGATSLRKPSFFLFLFASHEKIRCSLRTSIPLDWLFSLSFIFNEKKVTR